MTDYESQITALKARRAAAVRERIRLEHARDTAQTSANDARERLLREFQVATLDQARNLLTAMEQELTDHVKTLTARLDDIGV